MGTKEVNTVYGTLHYPGNSGGNGNGSSTTVANAASAFHIYKQFESCICKNLWMMYYSIQ
jgi:beta-glucanase (GH16 family)